MTDKEYIQSLEERVQNLETILNAVIRYDFPDDDGRFRSHFTLYSEFRYDTYNKDEKVAEAIDELEYLIIKREKENS